MQRIEDQYQVGDPVVFEAEGVITSVVGYYWAEAVHLQPRVVAYKLDCGIPVPAAALRRATPEECVRVGLRAARSLLSPGSADAGG